jgi:hypothetical protein
VKDILALDIPSDVRLEKSEISAELFLIPAVKSELSSDNLALSSWSKLTIVITHHCNPHAQRPFRIVIRFRRFRCAILGIFFLKVKRPLSEFVRAHPVNLRQSKPQQFC